MTDPSRGRVVVIGAGPAGLAAAVAAADAGASVVMINEAAQSGGQIWRRDVNGAMPDRARDLFVRAEAASIMHRTCSTVIDARSVDGGHLLTIERGGSDPMDSPTETVGSTGELFASRVILATGARELFLPFPGWTLPGVVGVGAIQAMVKGGLDVRGKRIIIAGSGPLLVAVAASIAARGANILMIAEQAPALRMMAFSAGLLRAPRIARDALGYAAAISPKAFHFGSWVVAAHGESGVRQATITDGRRERTIDCDYLCIGYGLVPNTELAQLIGCGLSTRGVDADENQETTVPGVYAAGECVGVAGVDAAIAEGTIAGFAAGGARERAASHHRDREGARAWGRRLESTFALRPELRKLATAETIVCRCEDVRLGSIDPAWTPRQAKLYARVGMGPCQGRVCRPSLEHLYGWGQDRVRAPIYPSLLSTLAAHGADHDTRGAK